MNIIERTKKHNLLAPSAAEVWTKCDAYLKEANKHANSAAAAKVSDEMLAGTKKHAVIEAIARRMLKNEASFNEVDEATAKSDMYNIVEVEVKASEFAGDTKFTRDAEAYAELLLSKIRNCEAIYIEKYYVCTDFTYFYDEFSSNEEILARINDENADICGGTADLVSAGTDCITVADYKSGDKEISARYNKQLMIYAFAVLNERYNYNLDVIRYMNTKVNLTIIQNSTTNTMHTDAQTVVEFFYTKIMSAIKRNFVEETEANLSACAYCRYKQICESRQNKMLVEALEIAKNGVNTIEDKSKFCVIVNQLKNTADTYKADIMSAMQNHEEHDYFNLKLETRRGKLKCKDNASLVAEMLRDNKDIAKYVTFNSKASKDFPEFFERGNDIYALVLR